MKLVSIVAVASVFLSLALAALVLWRRARSPVRWAFASGVVLMSIEGLFGCLAMETAGAVPPGAVGGLDAVHAAELCGWLRLRLLVMACVPAPWLLFSFGFARGSFQDSPSRARWFATVAGVLPIALAFAGVDELVTGLPHPADGDGWQVTLGRVGFVLHAILLLVSAVVLLNFERTFRASVGTTRWRIKYVLLGLTALFVARVYTSSQELLFGATRMSLLNVNVMVLPLASLLTVRSLLREGVFTVSVYPSPTVLRNSVTIVFIGVYLLLIGLFAKVVTLIGGDAAFPLKAFLVLLGLVGLCVALMSDRAQKWTRVLVSRHFQRPMHDYRKVWHAVTDATASLVSEHELSRAAVRTISETFQVLSVTAWLVNEHRDTLVLGASTSLLESGAVDLAETTKASVLITALASRPEPIDIDASKESWAAMLRACHPDQFQEGSHRICVPLVASGRLLGLILLGDRVNRENLSVEDLDLLRCMGDQIAANLLNIQLSERLLEAKEMEAFQTMSAFFVHDLKNTASTLSLMLQNLPTHFEDPAFRADALRAVGKSVTRINDLIGRLTLLRQKLEIQARAADVNDVVTNALGTLEGAAPGRLQKILGSVPAALLDPEQLQKVVTNLVLNAWDAAGTNGEVAVETSRQNGWAVISVRDNGCGMSPEFIRQNLFRPFQTTKKRGVGIGMFHTKAIVDAHRGKIEVESQPGKGTTFRVLLPLHENEGNP